MSSSQSSSDEVVSMREVALTAAFVAMVFLSTSLFYIALVSSSGFFNLGEAFVYLAALIGGPIVGALAGGIGAALADMVLGYGLFAPATLLLKGMEGFTVGFLYQRGQQINQRIRYIILGVITVFLVAFSIFVITPDLQLMLVNIIKSIFPIPSELGNIEGSSTIQGAFIIFIPSLSGEILQEEIGFELPGIILVLISVVLSGIMWYVELRLGEKGKMILSCLLAGPIIVVGYFLYEILILGIPFGGALFEIPFNIAQVIFGILIAVPIVSYLHELGIVPEEKKFMFWRKKGEIDE
ncbi:MAG: ECF transporter S component [Candidatus Hodarchaeales archaeon]|jgi:uncharacterized membrane protein